VKRRIHVLGGFLRATELRRRTTEEHHDAIPRLLLQGGVDECCNITRFGKAVLSATSVGDGTLDERDGLRRQGLRRNEDGVKQTEAISGDVENRTSGMTLKGGIETGNERCIELDISLMTARQ
jgi:hypothetical protein